MKIPKESELRFNGLYMKHVSHDYFSLVKSPAPATITLEKHIITRLVWTHRSHIIFEYFEHRQLEPGRRPGHYAAAFPSFHWLK